LPWKWTLCILRQNPNLIFFHCPVRITNSFSLVGKNQNPSRFLSLDSLQGSKCNALRFNIYVFLLEKHRSLFFLYSVSSKFQSLEQVFMAPLLWSTWATTCGLAFWERDAHLISLDDLHLSHIYLIDYYLSRIPYLFITIIIRVPLLRCHDHHTYFMKAFLVYILSSQKTLKKLWTERLMWHLCFLTQGRTTCQETPHKSLARSKGRIKNYDCCHEIGQLCNWRHNPNLIVFLLPRSYHEGYHPFSLQRLMWHLCFLTQGRTTCQETPHKILARSKGRI